MTSTTDVDMIKAFVMLGSFIKIIMPVMRSVVLKIKPTWRKNNMYKTLIAMVIARRLFWPADGLGVFISLIESSCLLRRCEYILRISCTTTPPLAKINTIRRNWGQAAAPSPPPTPLEIPLDTIYSQTKSTKNPNRMTMSPKFMISTLPGNRRI